MQFLKSKLFPVMHITGLELDGIQWYMTCSVYFTAVCIAEILCQREGVPV